MLHNILSIVTRASSIDLVTLDRVKAELGITDKSSDDILGYKITEASDDCAAFLGYRVPQETVTEMFWHGLGEPFNSPEYILLHRTPVTAITSVVRTDDIFTYDPTHYRLDEGTGQLYHINTNGFPWPWWFNKALTVTYQAGYVLTGNDATLPPGIAGAALELVSDFWFARGRDPSIKSEATVGIDTVDYWVGTVGDPSELPPRVQMKLAPYRRIVV